jgi:hypothetical protein
VKFVNAGIGGTNSVYGAMRLNRDVLDSKPDLVIVEWAVNNKEGLCFRESYEGCLRRILRAPQRPAVIQLFFMHKDGQSDQVWQEMLGRHYGLPMVSFRDAMFPEISTGRMAWETLYADVVHPNDEGHNVASKLLIHLLESTRSPSRQTSQGTAAVAEVPAPMISNLYENCRYADRESLKPVAHSGWVRSADGSKWECPPGDASIEFEVEGKAIFLGFDLDPAAAGRVKYSINGGAVQELKAEGDRPPVASGLDEGKHRLRLETSGIPPHGPGEQAKFVIWGLGGALGL